MNHFVGSAVGGDPLASLFAQIRGESLYNVFDRNGLVIPLLVLAVVVMVVIVGLIVAGSLRGRDRDDEQDTHQMLTKFREMHAKGELSDQEYRTIKTQLAAKMQAALKSSQAAPPPNPTVEEGSKLTK